jgi:hypothetical protein
MALQNLSVGVDDWQACSWLEGYYPEGLPEDWRFDYYLNDFRSALIAQAQWQAWSAEVLEELQAVQREGGGLYLRIDQAGSIDPQQAASVTQALAGWLVGVLVFDETWPSSQTHWYGLAVTRVSRQQACGDWQWAHEGWLLSGAPCGWVAALPSDPKQQVALLKAFVASLSGHSTQVGFFVAAEAVTAAQLQQFKTLAELLGY